MKIDPSQYGTAAEVAAAVGMKRTTLDAAMRRADKRLDVVATYGGTLLVSVASAEAYRDDPPRPGPKPLTPQLRTTAAQRQR